MRSRPDVLVLGGGFVLGEAWLTGVLAGLEDGAELDLRRCEYLVGTSAGAIVAARLVAGQSPRRPAGAAAPLPTETPEHAGEGARLRTTPTPGLRQLTSAAGDWALAWATPLASLWLAAWTPSGALGRSLALRAIGRGSGSLDDLRDEVERSGARFDGRLRVAAVKRSNGRRVVFGRPSSPAAAVGAAVVASCAVPWLFEPVRIGGQEYVDGAVWSPTNLDAAPAGRGSQVLCLNPIAGLGGGFASGSGGGRAATGGPVRRVAASGSSDDGPAATAGPVRRVAASGSSGGGSAATSGPGRALAAARIASRALTAIEVGSLRRRGATVETVSPDADSADEMNADPMSSEPAERVLAAGYRQGRRLATGSAR